MVAPRSRRAAVLAALRAAHPYEEPAFDVVAVEAAPDGTGLGRIATLTEPEPLRAFVTRVRRGLPATTWGARLRRPGRDGVAGGAVRRGGDSLLAEIARAGVQAYVTADLRHHPADEHRRASGVALVDVAHWASEYPWCGQAAALLRRHFADVPVTVSTVRTDPWNVEECSHES